MKSIWIVTRGEYSDYHILAVFASEEEAKEFVGGSTKAEYDYTVIEEWPLGMPKDDGPLQETWTVVLDTKTGEVKPGYITSNWEQHPRDWSESVIPQRFERLWDTQNPVYISNAVGRSVISQEHAMKLAVEARQAWLRSKNESL